jgi:hypothetical protein
MEALGEKQMTEGLGVGTREKGQNFNLFPSCFRVSSGLSVRESKSDPTVEKRVAKLSTNYA